MTVPEQGQIHYKLMSDSFKKNWLEPIRQATPMMHEVLMELFEQVEIAQELEAVAWTAVLVGFCLIFRISNLGPETRDKFQLGRDLARGDLTWENGVWNVQVRWTKTLQYKNRIIKAPLVPCLNKTICPVFWITRMIKVILAVDNEPLFLVREGKQRFPLTAGQVTRLLKKWIKNGGLNHKMYTGHCLRRGGLNWAHKAKLSREALKILGDWGSSAYLRYIDLDYESRIKSGKRMAKVADNICRQK